MLSITLTIHFLWFDFWLGLCDSWLVSDSWFNPTRQQLYRYEGYRRHGCMVQCLLGRAWVVNCVQQSKRSDDLRKYLEANKTGVTYWCLSMCLASACSLCTYYLVVYLWHWSERVHWAWWWPRQRSSRRYNLWYNEWWWHGACCAMAGWEVVQPKWQNPLFCILGEPSIPGSAWGLLCMPIRVSKFTNVFFIVALTSSVTSTTPLLGVEWIHLLFNWAYKVLPAPSRGESTLNSPAIKPVPNLLSHGGWQPPLGLPHVQLYRNRLRLCTTYLSTPEGWKAELAS